MHGPEDAEVSMRSLASYARCFHGHSRFVLIGTPRGRGGVQDVEVAGAFREMRVRREEEKNELHETIEHMNEMPGGLMFTMKRNHKLLEDVPELGPKLCQEINKHGVQL